MDGRTAPGIRMSIPVTGVNDHGTPYPVPTLLPLCHCFTGPNKCGMGRTAPVSCGDPGGMLRSLCESVLDPRVTERVYWAGWYVFWFKPSSCPYTVFSF